MDRAIACQPCVCGGVIYRVSTIEFIGVAVELHNQSLSHRLWRLSREGPTVDNGDPGDLSRGRDDGTSASPERLVH